MVIVNVSVWRIPDVEAIKVISRSKAILWRTNEGYCEVRAISKGLSERFRSVGWEREWKLSKDRKRRTNLSCFRVTPSSLENRGSRCKDYAEWLLLGYCYVIKYGVCSKGQRRWAINPHPLSFVEWYYCIEWAMSRVYITQRSKI